MGKREMTIETTDTFQGTLGVRVSVGKKVLWAGYVFPLYSKATDKIEWAVDAYIGTQEFDYFVNVLEVDENYKDLEETVRREVELYLGPPTFDIPARHEELSVEVIPV